MKSIVITINLIFISICLFCQIPAFPGAEGFGAIATGGRGGEVIYVTNLNTSGSGSLQAALDESGKRYILFKVSGVIPGTLEVPVGHGDFTLAGQTSPSGIIVRGFQSYNDENVSSSNFIIRHLKSRIGDIEKYPTPFWMGSDGLTLGGVHNAIVDRCSFAHANDEAVDISRSSGLTIQNCILAETLGGHSNLGGMLINYSSPSSRLDSLSIHHNVWSRIGGRMPEISCETPFCNDKIINVELSDNLFWDPQIELWYEGVTGNNGFFNLKMNAVNNYSFANSSYGNAMFHFDLLNFSKNFLFFSGNQLNLYPQYKDYQLFYCCNDFNQNNPNNEFGLAQRATQRFDFPTITYHPVSELRQYIYQNAGAFPRDAMDQRLLTSVNSGLIDFKTQNVDHYGDAFKLLPPNQGPIDSDDDGMPDYWELSHGLNRLTQDHNGNQLSLQLTGMDGYTNLECYLNCLSDALVSGNSTGNCGINLNITTNTSQQTNINQGISISPNPVKDVLDIEFMSKSSSKKTILITNYAGQNVQSADLYDEKIQISTQSWSSGIYFLRYFNNLTGKMVTKKIAVLKNE